MGAAKDQEDQVKSVREEKREEYESVISGRRDWLRFLLNSKRKIVESRSRVLCSFPGLRDFVVKQ